MKRGIDGSHYVTSRDGLDIFCAVLVGLLNLVFGVAKVNMVTLFSAKVFFPGRLNSCHAGKISPAIFSVMAVYIGGVDLGNIAKKVSSGIDRIVPDTSCLSMETGEMVFDLVEAHICLGGEGADHRLALISDSGAIASVFVHFLSDEVRLYIQYFRQGESVEFLYVPGVYKDVVRYLVANEYIPVPVVNDSARGVNGLKKGGIPVSVLLVASVQYLEREYLA